MRFCPSHHGGEKLRVVPRHFACGARIQTEELCSWYRYSKLAYTQGMVSLAAKLGRCPLLPACSITATGLQPVTAERAGEKQSRDERGYGRRIKSKLHFQESQLVKSSHGVAGAQDRRVLRLASFRWKGLARYDIALFGEGENRPATVAGR